MIKAPYEIPSFIKISCNSLTMLVDGSRATPEDSLKKTSRIIILIRPSVFLIKSTTWEFGKLNQY